MNNQTGRSNKETIFFGVFWALGILLASFWGLGWFFLFVTIKRLISHIPSLQNGLKRMLGIEPLPDNTDESNSQEGSANIVKWIILISWVAITVLVFCKLNFPLIELLKMK